MQIEPPKSAVVFSRPKKLCSSSLEEASEWFKVSPKHLSHAPEECLNISLGVTCKNIFCSTEKMSLKREEKDKKTQPYQTGDTHVPAHLSRESRMNIDERLR